MIHVKRGSSSVSALKDSGPAIQVRDLGKRYFLRHLQLQQLPEYYRYQTLREVVAAKAKRLLNRNNPSAAPSREEFWPLRHVSFDVEPGQVIGIIGRNGAGKSTLLKLLSRVTKPNEGEALLRGKVGSLLEVGVGFHQELTGRENIFLSGSVLGMPQRETARKFDEIVAFAEIERFLDTPVKRYSSGMYVRLAFAVASHLEPEILIIDEVLAVGDMSFQQKCLGKMRQIARGGKTILFVSHNMAVVRNMCSHCLLLDQGRVRMLDQAPLVIDEYCRRTPNQTAHRMELNHHPSWREDRSRVLNWVAVSDLQTKGDVILMGGGLQLEIGYEFPETPNHVRLGVIIEDGHGQPLLHFSPNFQGPSILESLPRRGVIRCEVPWLNLMEGEYHATLQLQHNFNDAEEYSRAVSFRVVEDDVFGTGKAVPRGTAVAYLDASWKTIPASAGSAPADLHAN